MLHPKIKSNPGPAQFHAHTLLCSHLICHLFTSQALVEAKAAEQKAVATVKSAEQRASQAEASAKVADLRAAKGVKALETLEQENK